MSIFERFSGDPSGAIIYLGLILFSTLLHEYGHALTGFWLGDDTNTKHGRFNWDPVRYLNWIGIAMFALVGFGFLGQAPVNPWRIRNGNVGMAMISAAGPAANAILVVLGALAYQSLNASSPGWLSEAFFNLVVMNTVLCVFNLIPLPPLDGSRILASLLPGELGASLRAGMNQQTMMLALFALVVFQQPIGRMLRLVVDWVLTIAQMV